ncbi:transcription factor 23-like [Denticeps clupeoides]|uniref:transcription factor 23-like n=1 Tax=Denticeps clupeoides TaxID=299321 RepID=UPI0010A489A2|nr:transcription factor 23-like [Denticeps clupeoides]
MDESAQEDTVPTPAKMGAAREARLLGKRRGPSARKQAKKWTDPDAGAKSHTSPENAARERSRVRNLREAFHRLQAALPSVPPDTKLSKLDVLVLAANYIAHLTEVLDQGAALNEYPSRAGGFLHPVKKWPMRSLLYCGSVGELLTGVPANQDDSATSTPVAGVDSLPAL